MIIIYIAAIIIIIYFGIPVLQLIVSFFAAIFFSFLLFIMRAYQWVDDLFTYVRPSEVKLDENNRSELVAPVEDANFIFNSKLKNICYRVFYADILIFLIALIIDKNLMVTFLFIFPMGIMIPLLIYKIFEKKINL